MELGPFLPFLMSTPFERFEVCLNDGRSIPVIHPEFVSVYQGGLGFYFFTAEGFVEFIEGNAVTSIRSTALRELSDFVRD